MNTSVRFSLVTVLVHIAIALLLLLLLWFEIVPTQSERDAQSIVNTGFQRERSRLFVNAAYALRYHPQTEKAQAICGLSDKKGLPLFWCCLPTYIHSIQKRFLQQVATLFLFLGHARVVNVQFQAIYAGLFRVVQRV
jgi:hypothetical protein